MADSRKKATTAKGSATGKRPERKGQASKPATGSRYGRAHGK